ncbi:MAG: FAD-dependent thymidylate synthase [Rickettsiaceae bacterium]
MINSTKRVISPSLEEILYEATPVLDHGFVRVVDYMGNDSSIVQAARVSYGSGTKHVSQDRGLIRYLMRHKHTTPFEMCDIKMHIKLPIFVARQWIRHRTASVNEYSARYSILSNEFYLPSKENIAAQSSSNMQGRSQEEVPAEYANHVLNTLKDDALLCYKHYVDMMNTDEAGNIIDENKISLARELARMNLTLNYYTQWYWKINLHNLLHFLALRADKHAQYEIRVYADAILKIVKSWVPFTYEAFEEYIMHGTNISKSAIKVIQDMIAGKKVTQESSSMTKREWNELMNALSLDQKGNI